MPAEEDALESLEQDIAQLEAEPGFEPQPESQTEPEPEPQVTPEPAPEPKPAPEPDPVQAREKVLQELSRRYVVPQEVVQRLTSAPGEVLPQFAAKLYLDVFDAVMGAMSSQLPQMVMQVQSARQAEEQFFNEFPELRDPKYRQSIIQAAGAVRASGEKLSPEQVRERVGRMVMAAHGLQLRPARSARPPVPAAPGGGGQRRPLSQQDQNFWTDLAVED